MEGGNGNEERYLKGTAYEKVSNRFGSGYIVFRWVLRRLRVRPSVHGRGRGRFNNGQAAVSELDR